MAYLKLMKNLFFGWVLRKWSIILGELRLQKLLPFLKTARIKTRRLLERHRELIKRLTEKHFS